ncbi:MAG: UDP-N-acetylmuramate dehydrogenase [Armatimonadota bacterium]
MESLFDAAKEIRKLVRGRVAENEPMALHTTLGVGGPADVFAEVETQEDLAALVKYVSQARLLWMVLGDGTNLLVSDRGVRGVVIALTGDFKKIDARPPFIEAGAAARMSAVADAAAENNLAGLEGVGVVPGTLGGAIVMNAGTHRGYIADIVENVSVLTPDGSQRVLSREECGFTYRGSRFQSDRSLIVIGAKLRLRPGDRSEIRRSLEEIRRHRAQTQPQGRSAGCFFKNPRSVLPGGDCEGEVLSAGQLIESAGGKGLRLGRAVVSEIHANFIINEGGATASDVRALAERVRELVRERHGVELEYEVRIVGEWREGGEN